MPEHDLAGAGRARPLRRGDRLDTMGATASLLCAVHCALMPLVISLLPLLGLAFLADEAVEWGLLGLSATLATTSLCLGYREHGSRRALAMMATGVTLLTLGRIVEVRDLGHYGVVLLVLGGCTVAASHLLNRALCHACRVCCRHHERGAVQAASALAAFAAPAYNETR